MDSINKEPPKDSTSKEPPQHEAAEKWLDLRNRVARIQITLEALNRMFFTPETEILRIIPTYEHWQKDGVLLEIRHPKLKRIKEGQKLDDLTTMLCYTVCDAGHLIRIFIKDTGSLDSEEISLLDKRSFHEKCTYDPADLASMRPFK